MGRTACTEPQCLYKGALYPFVTWFISHLEMESSRWMGND